MKVVYNGPQPSRTLEVGPTKCITVTRGEPFNVPDEVGEQLLEQCHYSTPGGSSSAKKSKAGKKPGKRAALNAMAKAAGVEHPEKLKNMAEVKKATKAAEAPPAAANDNPGAGEADGQKGA